MLGAQALVQSDTSCRDGLPVRPAERIVSREDAASIFCLVYGAVSASSVVSHTDPVQAPAAPSATEAAICRPVTIPPAASTGVSRPPGTSAMASRTSGISTIVVTSPQCPPASVPWATIRSTPACTCLIACSLAPTSAATGMPRSLPASIMYAGGTPRALAINLIGWLSDTSSRLSPVSPDSAEEAMRTSSMGMSCSVSNSVMKLR